MTTWNEFRAEHKGKTMKEIASLWKQYKEGVEEAPEEKLAFEDVIEDIVEQDEVVEEVAEPTKEVDHIAEYNRISKRLTRFRPSMKHTEVLDSESLLLEYAIKTAHPKYECFETDGWKLWLGPSQDCILVNETQNVAFGCNRRWWQANYQGAKYVSYETVATHEILERLLHTYVRRRAFVDRPPHPGLEIKLPLSMRDFHNRV